MKRTWSTTDVEQFLAGERRPDWAFVQAFSQLVIGNKQWRRAELERQIRPRWEAAAPRLLAALRRPNRAVRRLTGSIAAAAVLAAVAAVLAVVLPSSSPSVAAGPPTCTTAATPPTASASNQLNQPYAIAVDGAHVWVANFGSSTVTELNASDGSLVRVLSSQVPPAMITNPASGADIATPQTIYATGTVQHLQPGHHLLLFLQWEDKDGSWQPILGRRPSCPGRR